MPSRDQPQGENGDIYGSFFGKPIKLSINFHYTFATLYFTISIYALFVLG